MQLFVPKDAKCDDRAACTTVRHTSILLCQRGSANTTALDTALCMQQLLVSFCMCGVKRKRLDCSIISLSKILLSDSLLLQQHPLARAGRRLRWLRRMQRVPGQLGM